MKSILVGMLFLLPFFHTAQISIFPPISVTEEKSDYCEGWDVGWSEGYKYVKGQNSLPPLPPLCPLPKLGRSKYKDGYNDGFLAGQKKAKNS